MAPPATAELPDGTSVALIPLAQEICTRHLERHPEDVERYGHELAMDWCVHDQQHILAWAVEDRDLEGQIRWLAGVLDTRGYPVPSLVDSILQGAEIVNRQVSLPAGEEIAARMRAAVEGL
jgi:hypothetical protein